MELLLSLTENPGVDSTAGEGGRSGRECTEAGGTLGSRTLDGAGLGVGAKLWTGTGRGLIEPRGVRMEDETLDGMSLDIELRIEMENGTEVGVGFLGMGREAIVGMGLMDSIEGVR